MTTLMFWIKRYYRSENNDNPALIIPQNSNKRRIRQKTVLKTTIK